MARVYSPARADAFSLRSVEISDGKAGRITVTCVVAREIGAPKGVKPIEWRLLTNRLAPTLEHAVELIDRYRARWEIEIYFHVLKGGCEVEALQLSAIGGSNGRWLCSWWSPGASPI
jgi:IS4 transposase